MYLYFCVLPIHVTDVLANNYKLVPEWKDPFIFDIFCEIAFNVERLIFNRSLLSGSFSKDFIYRLPGNQKSLTFK